MNMFVNDLNLNACVKSTEIFISEKILTNLIYLPVQSISIRRGVLDITLCDKLVSDLRQVGGFLRILRFPPPIKTGRHDITDILLKMALNSINLNQTLLIMKFGRKC